MNQQQRIYLDNQATTPADPRVVEAMLPYFSDKFGNPHSDSHAFGAEASEAVEAARAQVAGLIGARPREIFFTSGATESNNIAIKGAALERRNTRRHVVTCVTEHLCVLNSVLELDDQGFDITYLPVDADGMIDLDELRAAVTGDTLLVSVMAVQNEVGVIQPMAEIGAICREAGACLHTDAAQAAGKIPLDVREMNIDLLSISGHKLYGPMGVGALYKRDDPEVRVAPVFSGGGQEQGVRPGTVPAPLAVGIGAACAIAAGEMAGEANRLRLLRDGLLQRITEAAPGIKLNGHAEKRIAGNLSISVEGLLADAMMAAMPDIAVSSGSACSSAESESSHVLRSLGLTDEQAEGSLRIGLGRFTTTDEINIAGDRLIEVITQLRTKGAANSVAAE